MSGAESIFWRDAPGALVERLEDSRTGLGLRYPCGCWIMRGSDTVPAPGSTTVPEDVLWLCEGHRLWMDGWEARAFSEEQRRRSDSDPVAQQHNRGVARSRGGRGPGW